MVAGWMQRPICVPSRSSTPMDTFFSFVVSEKPHRVDERNPLFTENRYDRSYEIVESRRLALRIARLVAGELPLFPTPTKHTISYPTSRLMECMSA